MENERLVSPEKLHEDEQSAGAPVSLNRSQAQHQKCR